jgi:hypothetical protein
MVTVLRADGFRVVIYPNDHRPAHVHVISAEHEAVFNLNCPNGPPTLRENYGFSAADIKKISGLLSENLQKLCDEWSAIHGTA